jgi:hypothetical protein
MSLVRSHYSGMLGARLTELRDKLAYELGSGCAADYATYRQIVGRIQGLDDALKISEDVDLVLNGE